MLIIIIAIIISIIIIYYSENNQLYNNCIFSVFRFSPLGCSTHKDMPYRLCRSFSLIRLLTSGRVALPCLLSSSNVPSPRGVYIRLSGLLFLSSSFHSIVFCLVEVRHCWSPIGPPTPSVHCCVVERTLCWLIFRNQLEGVALFPFVFRTTDIDHYDLVLSSSSMPLFRPFVPACWTQLQS